MILIIDIDSKIQNLALKKIEKFYQDQGQEVIWNMPIMAHRADKIYVSCVFKDNRHLCEQWEGRAEIGGSGYDLNVKLPAEIEAVKPRINMGFTTRGCIRNCKFCIVPEKEGKIKVVGDLFDIWDGKSKTVTLLDNNNLALPDHFNLICRQAKENKIRLDFNQGLDHRLLTQDIVNTLKTIRHEELRFSFDHPRQIKTVSKAISLLKENKINRAFWYVLTGFDTTFGEDLERLNYLKSQGQTVYVQRYVKKPELTNLARWANQHNFFKAMTYHDFLKADHRQSFGIL